MVDNMVSGLWYLNLRFLTSIQEKLISSAAALLPEGRGDDPDLRHVEESDGLLSFSVLLWPKELSNYDVESHGHTGT